MVNILGYIPLQRPYMDLLWWQFGLLSLPFISLLMGILIALLAGLNMKIDAGRRTTNLYYLIVALALMSFNLAMIF